MDDDGSGGYTDRLYVPTDNPDFGIYRIDVAEAGIEFLTVLANCGAEYLKQPLGADGDKERQRLALYALGKLAEQIRVFGKLTGVQAGGDFLVQEIASAIMACATTSPNGDNPRPHRLLNFSNLTDSQDEPVMVPARSIFKLYGGAVAEALKEAEVRGINTIVANDFGCKPDTVGDWRRDPPVHEGMFLNLKAQFKDFLDRGQEPGEVVHYAYALAYLQKIGFQNTGKSPS